MKGAEALSALWDALSEDHKPPPPGAITVYDYVEKYGVTLASARFSLDRKVKDGEIETGMFRAEGRKGPVRFYWLKKGKAK